MAARLERLDKRTTPDEVYRSLREAILDGRLSPLEQLREAHLALDLGISRAPIREAFTRLEQEGLIVKLAYRGAFVAEVSAQTALEIAQLRYLVEPYAAQLAAPRLRDEERHRLVNTVDALRQAAEAKDLPASIDAHLMFHRLFYDYSGNGMLQELWEGWESKIRLFLTIDHRAYADLSAAHERLALLALNEDAEVIRDEIAHHLHAAPGSSLDSGPLPARP